MTTFTSDDLMTTWRNICTRAWSDDEFKHRLMEDPGKVLQEEGWKVPRGIRLKIIENEPDVMHLILPANPADIGPVERLSRRFVEGYSDVAL